MPTLQACQVEHATAVTLVDGSEVPIPAGGWIIRRGTVVVDSAAGPAFETRYETVIEGGLTLSPQICQAIEDTTGLGSTRAPADLLIAIERLATIEIGTVRIPFTPGQLEELKHRAGKRGHTVEQELQAVVDRIRDELFHRGPGG